MTDVETKRCPDCETVKPVTEFSTAGDERRRSTYCKPCLNTRQRESRRRLRRNRDLLRKDVIS